MNLLIIGANAAGMSAASRAKRHDSSLNVTVIEASETISLGNCGLPYVLNGEVNEWDDLLARTPEQMRARGISIRLGATVSEIDPEGRTVSVIDNNGSEQLPYDKLLIATGAMPVRPAWLNEQTENVHVLRTMQDGKQLAESLKGAARVCVVGGGYIGLELAEVLRDRGHSVVLVEAGPQVAGRLESTLASKIEEELQRAGVDLRTGCTVRSMHAKDGRFTGLKTDKGNLRADVLVVAVGARPVVDLAERAGIQLGQSGAIAVNERQETNVQDIYAAGDCTEVRHRVSKQDIWLPLALSANRAGRVAGVNMAGGDAVHGGVVGTSIFKCFGLGVAQTGLTPAQAEQAGLQMVSVELASTDRAGYMQSHRFMWLWLAAEKGSGRLLGAQLATTDFGHAKRIDTVAALLGVGATAADLAEADLAYAPHFSTTWDPWAVAAGRLRALV